MKGKRIGCFQETDDNDKFNITYKLSLKPSFTLSFTKKYTLSKSKFSLLDESSISALSWNKFLNNYESMEVSTYKTLLTVRLSAYEIKEYKLFLKNLIIHLIYVYHKFFYL